MKTGKQNWKWGLNEKEKLSQTAITPKVSTKGGKSSDKEKSLGVHLGTNHSA